MNGWVKIHRKIVEWEWYTDANTYRVFTHLLFMVNHEDNKWRGKLISVGQRITSQQHIAEELNLSVMQVRTALNKLKLTGEVTVKTTNKYSLITLNNYADYQSDDKPHNKRVTGKQQASNRQVTTNKNDKNDKNDKKREKPLHEKMEYLTSIPKEDLKEFSEKFNCTELQVIEKGESFIDYCTSKGARYKNYKSALRNAVRKDYGIRPTKKQPILATINIDELK